MITAKITLKSKKDQSLLHFHPWVFSGAIKNIEGNPKDGDIVEVCANKGRFLGLGHYQTGSIAVRIFSFEPVDLTQEFWIKKLTNAFELRKNLGLVDNQKTNAFRMVHAEGDGLPGFIADYYAGTLVFQMHSVGMYQQKEVFVECLKSLMGNQLKAVYDKSKAKLCTDNPTEDGYLFGNHDNDVKMLEYGHQFKIDFVKGQKTGFFLDQRENRKLLAEYSKGKKVLNAFSYTGGFSIYALKNDAALIHSVDSSAKAIDLLEENIELNKLDKSKHQSYAVDALEMVKNLETDYDVIVLDPPAFAKHRNARHQAVQGYKRLNTNAIRQIKSGGVIFTFSCSQVVDKALFNNTITAASIQAGRKVKVLHQLHQPADHPVNIFHPESEYLKGLVLEVQ